LKQNELGCLRLAGFFILRKYLGLRLEAVQQANNKRLNLIAWDKHSTFFVPVNDLIMKFYNIVETCDQFKSFFYVNDEEAK
jgi:hypothetical protein